jgi:hypothetical protein
MATSFTDKITRLANKLETYDAKITELTEQRNAVAAEMQDLLTVTTGTKTLLGNTKTAKTGSIGDKILNVITPEGWTSEELASKLKMTPSRIGLSLYHLTQKSKVYAQTVDAETKYYPAITASPAVARDTTPD